MNKKIIKKNTYEARTLLGGIHEQWVWNHSSRWLFITSSSLGRTTDVRLGTRRSANYRCARPIRFSEHSVGGVTTRRNVVAFKKQRLETASGKKPKGTRTTSRIAAPTRHRRTRRVGVVHTTLLYSKKKVYRVQIARFNVFNLKK